jgi:hypothetical protein
MMKKLILGLVVALTACGGGGEPFPQISSNDLYIANQSIYTRFQTLPSVAHSERVQLATTFNANALALKADTLWNPCPTHQHDCLELVELMETPLIP